MKRGPRNVRLCSPPPFAKNSPSGTAAQRAGRRYEALVQAKLASTYGPSYIPSPWISYLPPFGARCFVQPDGLLFFPRLLKMLCIEIKLKHCAAAYIQLYEKYIPLLQIIFPLWKICPLEYVRWFDFATATPAEPVLLRNLEEARTGNFSVHIDRAED